jgi:hypothetical protein
MKISTLIFISIFLLSVTFLFADDIEEISSEEAVALLSGTWGNPENIDSKPIMGQLPFHFQKMVLTETRRFETYYRVDETLPFNGGDYTIKNSWVDGKGNTFCQIKWVFDTGSMVYALYKLNDSRTVLESNLHYTRSILDEEKYPTEIVTHDIIVEADVKWSYENMYYNIYYRQQ